MAYASRSGRARTSASSPRAFGVCDRCGIWYNHHQLRWQFDWAGASLVNKRILVCNTCYDEPQQQLRSIILPADPVPIVNPRVEPYMWDEIDRRQLSGYNTIDPATGIPVVQGDTRVTSLSDLPTTDVRVTQQTGEPPGGKNQLPGTDPNAVTYRNIISVQNNGIGIVRVIVDTTSGMITGQKVTIAEVAGVTVANGNFTITVINPTAFDLQNVIFSGSYTGGGYVINNPSLPYGFAQVPRTGPL
jgi:Ubiquitin-activating enzyme E1 FCCH domain